jgi:chromosome segregation ATPase
MNSLLARKERIVKEESAFRKTLEENFSNLQKEKSDLQAEIVKIQDRLSSVEESLADETARRQRSDIEYAALQSQVNQASERSKLDLQALRLGIQALKKSRQEDARTIQIMAAELDRLSVGHAREQETAKEIQEELSKVKEKQTKQFEIALLSLRKGLEEQILGNQENISRTGEALAELRVLNGKIKAVDRNLR